MLYGVKYLRLYPFDQPLLSFVYLLLPPRGINQNIFRSESCQLSIATRILSSLLSSSFVAMFNDTVSCRKASIILSNSGMIFSSTGMIGTNLFMTFQITNAFTNTATAKTHMGSGPRNQKLKSSQLTNSLFPSKSLSLWKHCRGTSNWVSCPCPHYY